VLPTEDGRHDEPRADNKKGENQLKNPFQLVAYCGIHCGTDCEVFEAAHSDNVESKRRIAEDLEKHLGISIDPSELRCEGCQGPLEQMWFECRLCFIRRCAKEQGIPICTECEHYPCPVLNVRIAESENAPKNLEDIHRLGFQRWFQEKNKIFRTKYRHRIDTKKE